MTTPEALQSVSFAQAGYTGIFGLLQGPTLSLFYQHTMAQAGASALSLGDAQVAGAPAAYGDALMELLLDRLTSRVEEAVGLQLYPTYSYLRIYRRGDALPAHRDRPACEVSVSVLLGGDMDEPWPLWLEPASGPYPVLLQPGDAAVYRGVDLLHWREPLAGTHSSHVFLHYVDRNGPHAEWRFDKRQSLGYGLAATQASVPNVGGRGA